MLLVEETRVTGENHGVTCDRSVVFSRYSGFLHQKTDLHYVIEILLKVALNTINLTLAQSLDRTCRYFLMDTD